MDSSGRVPKGYQPKKSHKDDGLEEESPFKHGEFWCPC